MQDNATMQEATGFTFRTILDFFGVGDITGIEILFAALALVGGVLFIVYFFLVMIGGFAEGAIEGVFDVDVDMLGADASFQALTFQGIVTFAMIFGLVGLGISQESESAMLAVLGGTAAGGFSMYIVGRLLTTMHSLQQEGTVQVERSIGAEGTVYNRISPGKMGKVQVTFQGSLRTENAVHDLDETLDYGRPIRVIRTMGSTLVVEPLQHHKSDPAESE